VKWRRIKVIILDWTAILSRASKFARVPLIRVGPKIIPRFETPILLTSWWVLTLLVERKNFFLKKNEKKRKKKEKKKKRKEKETDPNVQLDISMLPYEH